MEYENVIKEIENLLEIEDFPQETKESVALSLAENILKRTLIEMIGIMSEEEAVTFDALTKEGKTDEAMSFVSSAHPEINDIVKRVGEEVIEEFTSALHN